MRFRALASWRRANPAPIGCILATPGSRRLAGRSLRRPKVPAWFPWSSRPKPFRSGAWAPPVAWIGPKTARGAGSESRTGPLEPRVSPVFRAAVSLGLMTFRRNRRSGKHPIRGVCAKAPPRRCTSRCISVDGRDLLRPISDLVCPQKAEADGSAQLQAPRLGIVKKGGDRRGVASQKDFDLAGRTVADPQQQDLGRRPQVSGQLGEVCITRDDGEAMGGGVAPDGAIVRPLQSEALNLDAGWKEVI